LGVAAILDAAITVVIPIFHRLSRAEVAVESETPPRLSTAGLSTAGLSTVGLSTAGLSTVEIDVEIAKLQARLAELEEMKRGVALAESPRH
jgi:hypothetical protein